MNKKAKITLVISFCAFAASIYSLAAAAAYQPAAVRSTPSTTVSPSDTAVDASAGRQPDEAPFRTKIIRLHRGKVAVFEENSETPVKLLPTDVSQLPDDAVARLNEGIYAYTAEQYQNYIEDFS